MNTGGELPRGGPDAVQSHLVSQGEVTLAPLQQQPCDVCVAPLGGEHQGRGSLAVLDVSVCSAAQQQANHHHTAVSHSQVQGGLTRLWTAGGQHDCYSKYYISIL